MVLGMPAPEPALVVIACPHCGTRYQVPYGAIGPKGRTVQCAHCGQSWEAHAERPPVAAMPAAPPPAPKRTVVEDKDFGALAEEMLDEKFVIEEQRQKARREASLKAEQEAREAKARSDAALAAEREGRAAAEAQSEAAERAAAIARATAGTIGAAPPSRSPEHQRTVDEIKAAIGNGEETLDPEARRRQQQEFSRRQRSLTNRLPMARFRRAARFAVLGVMVLIVGGVIMLRGPIVGQFPQLAGAYAAVGLSVNVIGLEFRNVQTLQSLQQGVDVLAVEGTIASVADHEVAVPQVIVTLLDPRGSSVYEWSVTSKATELEPGETIHFETQLSSPPAGAKNVKLSFASSQAPPRPADDSAGVAVQGPSTSAEIQKDGPIRFAPKPTTNETDNGPNPDR